MSHYTNILSSVSLLALVEVVLSTTVIDEGGVGNGLLFTIIDETKNA